MQLAVAIKTSIPPVLERSNLADWHTLPGQHASSKPMAGS